MDKLSKPAGGLLAVIALAVLVNLMAWEWYGGSATVSVHLVWDILNGFMAAAIIIALAYHYRDKRQLDKTDGGQSRVTYSWLAANLLLYATVLLGIWFFRNWGTEYFAAERLERYSLVWQWVNPLFIAVMAATAGRLLYRVGSNSSQAKTG